MLNDPLFKFDPEKHLYTYAGVVEPSVTQLEQQFGLIDFSGVPKSRLEYKRVLGVAVHRACHLVDDCNLDEEKLSKPLVPYVEAYKKFCEITGFEARSEITEVALRSKKYRFCGSPDRQGLFVTKFGDEESLIDLKCTWKLYNAVGPQLQGYKILVEENYGIKIKKVYGLQLKGTGHYELKCFNDPSDKQDFLACVYLHWQLRNKYAYKPGGLFNEFDIIAGNEGTGTGSQRSPAVC